MSRCWEGLHTGHGACGVCLVEYISQHFPGRDQESLPRWRKLYVWSHRRMRTQQCGLVRSRGSSWIGTSVPKMVWFSFSCYLQDPFHIIVEESFRFVVLWCCDAQKEKKRKRRRGRKKKETTPGVGGGGSGCRDTLQGLGWIRKEEKVKAWSDKLE